MMHRRPHPYYSPNDFMGYPEQAFYQMPPSPQFQQYPYEPYQTTPYPSSPDQSQINQNPFQQLAKPTQPTNWPDFMQQNQQSEPFMQQSQLNQQSEAYQQYQQSQNFYPPPNQQPRPNFMSQFQGNDGQLDFNKMLSTVGHLANTVQQVSPVIQQFGSLMKSFKV